MPSYIEYPIQTDPDVLLQDWLDQIRIFWPNFQPNEGSLAFQNARALLNAIAESREVGAIIPEVIFRYFGPLINVPPTDPQPASVETTWTVRDDAGYGPIPEGTILSIEGQFFETIEPVTVLAGNLNVAGISVVAIEDGAAGNQLGEPGAEMALEEAYEYVTSVIMAGETSGGADAEDQDEYMDRLRTRLTLLTPRAITIRDVATMAATIEGVERAVAIKGWNPVLGTGGHPGTASVAVIDAVGGLVPNIVKEAVSAAVLGPDERLINANLFVIDPTWTPVDVSWDGICYPGAEPDQVEALGNAKLAELFDPNLWGQPLSGDQRLWYNKTVVSLFDVAGALDQVEGLDRVTSIDIGLNGGAQTSADHNLPGTAPLATPGAFVGAVTAP